MRASAGESCTPWRQTWSTGHRHPLTAVRSIAAGFTSTGVCRNPSERRWDARAWNCATRFVPLPVPRLAIDAQDTCRLGRPARLKLALHYWVTWNLLADRWATATFAVESVDAAELAQRWCAHCASARTCRCPSAAEHLVRSNATARSERVRPRRGHGASARRKKVPLTWAALAAVDPSMTRVAQLLAREYGYSEVGTE